MIDSGSLIVASSIMVLAKLDVTSIMSSVDTVSTSILPNVVKLDTESLVDAVSVMVLLNVVRRDTESLVDAVSVRVLAKLETTSIG